MCTEDSPPVAVYVLKMRPFRVLVAASVASVLMASAASAAPLAITSGPEGVTSDPRASFTFTVPDGTTATCALDGAAPEACTSPRAYADLADGAHRFDVRSGDVQQTRSWTVDTRAPDTTFSQVPPQLTNERIARFTLSSEPESRFECALNNQPFVMCGPSFVLQGIPDGRNVFTARAVDAAGNIDLTPAAYAWTVDATGPPAPGRRLLPLAALAALPTSSTSLPKQALGDEAVKAALSSSTATLLDAANVLLLARAEPNAVSSIRFRRVTPSPTAIGCANFVGCAFASSPQTEAIVRRTAAFRLPANVGLGVELCHAAVGIDALGNRTEGPQNEACAVRPSRITSGRFKRKGAALSTVKGAWGGKAVKLRASSPSQDGGRVDADLEERFPSGGTKAATHLRRIVLVGRQCPSCGAVSLRVTPVGVDVREGGPVAYTGKLAPIVKVVSFRGPARAVATRSVPIPALPYVALRLRATKAPVELSGIGFGVGPTTWSPSADGA